MAKRKTTKIYFIGCDMGGWHNGGDAIAVCHWDGNNIKHDFEGNKRLFYPVDPKGQIANLIGKCKKEKAKIIIAVDAALAWPVDFVSLVDAAPTGKHLPSFAVRDGAIKNPYLYRETERFIKANVQTGAKERPLTASGDKFGNNSSKAQALVAWFKSQLPGIYRPPFDTWNTTTAKAKRYTLIEVYPAASLKSSKFRKLQWPIGLKPTMQRVGNTDIADAKRCAMTAVCYAAVLGLLSLPKVPQVYFPNGNTVGKASLAKIEKEGWIFCPH